jgi:hypothetical protein
MEKLVRIRALLTVDVRCTRRGMAAAMMGA